MNAEELCKQFIERNYHFIKECINNDESYFTSYRREDFVKLSTALGISIEVVDGIVQ